MKIKSMQEIREQVLDLFKDKEVILFAMNKVTDEDFLKKDITNLSDEERSCLVMSKAESSHFIIQLGIVLATDNETRAKIEQAIKLSYLIPSSDIHTQKRPDGSIEIKSSYKEEDEDNKNNNSNIQ